MLLDFLAPSIEVQFWFHTLITGYIVALSIVVFAHLINNILTGLASLNLFHPRVKKKLANYQYGGKIYIQTRLEHWHIDHVYNSVSGKHNKYILTGQVYVRRT